MIYIEPATTEHDSKTCWQADADLFCGVGRGMLAEVPKGNDESAMVAGSLFL